MPTATYLATADTYISAGAPTTNYGNGPLLGVGPWIDENSLTVLRSLFRFQPNLPPNARVDDAQITLPSLGTPETYEPTNTFELATTRPDWDETTVTWQQANSLTAWATPGGDSETIAIQSFPGGSDPLFFPDLATQIAQCLLATPGQIDLLLKRTDEAGHLDTWVGWTRDNDDPTLTPALQITYTVLPPRALFIAGGFQELDGNLD